ncbi:iron ABC transporter ATP-binding protein [Streptomyces spinoverrucosus]|uniref:Iron ABC transporter ATP-binding protein n=1 Tax=Streptomyces spinoverrucosus TaxID=284043 RepID=A0A4Y3V8D0_9ACTN|nr:ABC transporter ATP-binding protein [Streptomyces spinoverrucosus]GEC03227.1 iron ABC transporter ATP-binding protein [Streptomyces spinoverrucosus]GHB37274.1 iron ABC transporter ATP-binding protein [Streptomyces spinoverrucosus]
MLTVESLKKSYDDTAGRRSRRPGNEGTRVYAVGGVDFEVHDGELFTLLGPSGCGKTTTLRSVAGLERPTEGRVTLGGRVLFDAEQGINMRANRRGLGMVFQSYAIWPHMTVFKNVSFPLEVLPRTKRPGRREIEERVEQVLDVIELGAYASRPATKLSGGQQQRLALGRALVTRPELMLLDEPLSNLDAKLRETMRFELKRLQRELNLTAIYVTHDQSEALVMSNRIAVMNQGRIEQIGKPREIYTKPATRFVAEFIGTSNFMEAKVVSVDGREVRVDTAHGPLVAGEVDKAPAVGDTVMISIRPECVDLSPERRGNVPNEWSGQVLTRAFLGDVVDHIVGVGDLEIRNRSNPNLSIPPGTEVHFSVAPDKVTLVPVD